MPSSYTQTQIERGGSESGPFEKVSEIPLLDTNGNVITQWYDEQGTRNHTYLIRGFDPTANRLTDFVLGYFPLLPREVRLTTYIRQYLPDVLQDELTDQVINWSFRFAVSSFNVHPPVTTFTLDSFPLSCEPFLIMGAQVNIALLKQAKLGVRDFSYSDMGFSLNVDRGSKLLQSAEHIGKIYNETIGMAKWQFTPMGIGLGTLPLPVSVGASLSRGMLNVLDIMNQMSR